MSASHAMPFVTAITIALGIFSIAKCTVFFLVGYARRRAALDKSYAGKAVATAVSDPLLLIFTLAFTAALLTAGGEPISFLGGLFVGATLIQLFFHAFHHAERNGRDAPEPRSPLKIMSYAIQDRPQLAWKEMLAMTAIIVACIALHLFR